MNSGKALLGVLAGMAAGAAIGLLFAPEKGSITRKNISRKGEDLAEALNDRIDAKFNELLRTIKGNGRTSQSPKDVVTSNKSEWVG